MPLILTVDIQDAWWLRKAIRGRKRQGRRGQAYRTCLVAFEDALGDDLYLTERVAEVPLTGAEPQEYAIQVPDKLVRFLFNRMEARLRVDQTNLLRLKAGKLGKGGPTVREAVEWCPHFGRSALTAFSHALFG